MVKSQGILGRELRRKLPTRKKSRISIPIKSECSLVYYRTFVYVCMKQLFIRYRYLWGTIRFDCMTDRWVGGGWGGKRAA